VCVSVVVSSSIFFFQAEDGIRDFHVTGVQTCALPICHPNLIWAQLADDRLSASFIADGHHLPAETFKAMLRAKGLERALLVSDKIGRASCRERVWIPRGGGRVRE